MRRWVRREVQSSYNVQQGCGQLESGPLGSSGAWMVPQSWFCLTQAGWLAVSDSLTSARYWGGGAWERSLLGEVAVSSQAPLRATRCTCPVKGSGVRRHHYRAPVCTRDSALSKRSTHGGKRTQAWKFSAGGAWTWASLSPHRQVYRWTLYLSSCPWLHICLSTFWPIYSSSDSPITFV